MTMSRKMAALQGEAHFFEESMNPAKVKEYLGRPKVVDKLKGMKWLLAMVSKGRDVSDFFSDVVKNMAVRSVELKKMIYIYLVHYADSDAQCRELALLSINSFQNDLRGANQLIKALALRVMTSIRVPDIIQIQLLAVRDCASDSSPYVRKCAANAIPKIYTLDPEQAPQLCQVLEKLLKDGSTMVLGSAVAAFTEVCPNKFELLHPAYRKLCYLLADVDEWGQMAILATLQRYVRTQFTSPQGSKNKLGSSSEPPKGEPCKKVRRRVIKPAFYSSEEDESVEEEVEVHETPVSAPEIGSVFTASDADIDANLDPDHRLLLRCSFPLLKSRNSGVVLAVCALHYCSGSRNGATLAQIAKAMARILRNRREIQYVVLDSIRAMAGESPSMFRPFLQEFFVKASDPLFSCTLKLDILTLLVSSESCSAILRELQTYVLHRDKSFVCAAVRAVGRVAGSQPEVTEQCLQGLMTLVTCSKTGVVVAEAVVVLRQLLQQNPDIGGMTSVLNRLALLLIRSFMTQGREINGDKQGEHEGGNQGSGQAASSFSQPAARASIIWTLGEHPQHVSALAPDLLRLMSKTFPELEEEVKMQVLNFAVKIALHMPSIEHVQSLAAFVLEMARFDLSHDLRDRARFMTAMLGLASAEDGVDERALLALNAKASQVLLRPKLPPTTESVNLSYQGMQHFVLGSLSAVVGHRVDGYQPLPDWCTVQPDVAVRDAPQEESRTVDSGESNESFYSGSSPEESSESGSDSESEFSQTESDSETETGSYSESLSEDSFGSSLSHSGSGSDSDEGSSVSESSTIPGEEGVGLLHMGAATYGASAPAPQSEDLTGLIPSLSVQDLDKRGSPGVGELTSRGAGFVPPHAALPEPMPSNGMTQPAVGVNAHATPAGSRYGLIKHSGEALSFPSTLLQHEVGGGLQVDLQYKRGFSSPSTRSSTVLSMQLTFTNHGNTPIHRIRAMAPRDGTPVKGFTEIQMLGPGATVNADLSIDFGGRAKQVRFELKTGKGSFMLSLKPELAELLCPNFIAPDAFEAGMNALGGVNEAKTDLKVVPSDTSAVATRVLQAANVVMVLGDSGEGLSQWGFSGYSLADSMSKRVLIGVSLDRESGEGSLTICSDNAVLPSALLGRIKKAIQTGGC
ncbi:unnamed protein product [Discosporangium mesarthrocarpum]